MCLGQKSKTQQKQNKTKQNIKTVARAGNWTRELLHPCWMRYLWTTESTEEVYLSQPI